MSFYFDSVGGFVEINCKTYFFNDYDSIGELYDSIQEEYSLSKKEMAKIREMYENFIFEEGIDNA